MNKPDELASLLSEFARTLLTDFSIQDILDHLVVRIVEALPVTGAGVSLISPGGPPRYVAASNGSALKYERLQAELGIGPCMEAYETGAVVMSPDLHEEGRFPEFATAALDLGLRAVFSAPMQHSQGRLGALDLYRDSPGPLSERDLVTAQTVADVAAAYVLNAEAREDARKSAELFRENSLRDPLTGLPNRLLMQQRIQHAGERARRTKTTAAVLFADLDGFKLVNDAHGHGVGDQLLIAVAARLRALVRPGDTLARLGGDEFLFLCEDLSSPSDVESLVTRIDEAFVLPFSLSGMDLVMSASVGVAFSGPGETITDDLVGDADDAMYAAKRRRKHLTASAGADALAHNGVNVSHHLAHDLRAALSDGTLELAYQPMVRTTDGLVIGMEALLRWTHPTRGQIFANETVAIAERGGMIDEVGAWALNRSCRDRSRWRHAETEGQLDLAINVSAVQLLNPHLFRTVENIFKDRGVDPATIVIEITESILIRDGTRALTVLEDLKAIGVRLALDDFGTGYSSLSHLHAFPIDIVKIDQSFVGRITFDRGAAAIVAAVTSLAHELGMSVVAEGVETSSQVERLREIGCDAAQGYYIARPMSPADVSTMLRRSHPNAAAILPSRE